MGTTTVFEGTKKKYVMNDTLVSNLKTARRVVKNDWDMVFLIDGAERSGKSVMAAQMAYYCDPTLNLDRVTFTSDEFRNAILNAKPYTAVIYDEAYTGLSSRGTMSNINKAIVEMLAEIGQKNLFVFIVMPTFFDLDKYAALWRSRALIHIYTGDNFHRGFFAFYNIDRKKNLYLLGKKLYKYDVVKPNFTGRFSGYYPLDSDEYKKKKYDSLMARSEKNYDQEVVKRAESILWDRLKDIDDSKLSNVLKCKILGISEATYYRRLGAENETKLPSK